MRRIKIDTWKAKLPDGSERDENILMAISILLANKKPEEIPRGLDKFRLFNRLGKAFDKAEKTKVLELEEGDYLFLKSVIEKDIPCVWGMNQELAKAFESFLNAKEEE